MKYLKLDAERVCPDPECEQLAVDPFAGSGSIIEAADRIGATAWVCDADVTHRAAADRRARSEGTQPSLLGDA